MCPLCVSSCFRWSGFVEISDTGVAVITGRALPTRDRIDEEVLRLETMRGALRDDRDRRGAESSISRLEELKTILSF